ncbi:uncharacterized protein LOC117169542 [Belonocnema kinseyi]|uniref:uncharacterized protein LOC117169542 n=1 Tax=Belonocnema kinseyi TaxID=2817044 RepID=UPI00143D2836|nr:uncharacterized protein LOC117169542 [Belonocnema kinseyi]
MKIRIRILLLTYAVFQNFDDLNAMHPGSGANVGVHGIDQRSDAHIGLNTMYPESIMNVRENAMDLAELPCLEGSALYVNDAAYRTARKHLRAVERLPIPKNVTVFYGLRPIELWLDPITKKVFHAYFDGCYLPQPSYYARYNFLTRWVRLKDERHIDHDIVAYVGDQGRLIGVRAAVLPKGTRAINVTPDRWLIVHLKHKFDVIVNTEQKKVHGIIPQKGNLFGYEYKKRYLANVANIKFWWYEVGENGKPSGAGLVEDYFYPTGESFLLPGPAGKEKKIIGRPRIKSLNEVENVEASSSRRSIVRPRIIPLDEIGVAKPPAGKSLVFKLPKGL